MTQAKSAAELVRLIRSRAVSPVEVMEQTLKAIEDRNPVINAFVALRAKAALDEARALADDLAAGRTVGPLAGLPIGVKDLEDVQGMVTTYGSVPHKDNVAQRDSVQVERLKAAGAIVVGKTNTPEFGFTGFTKNRLFGVTRNPWNPERTPGGSSGGSAAAVAGGLVFVATGSDGGGSVRIPASYSGCFGLKTSQGRIPMGPAGLLPMFHIAVMGPLTRTVEDAALFLDCTAGYHPCDPFSLPHPGRSYLEVLDRLPRNLRIAYSPDLGYAPVQKDVLARVEAAVKAFEDMGHTVERWKGTFPDPGEAWSRLSGVDFYDKPEETLEKNKPDMGRTLVGALEMARTMNMADLMDSQKMRTELNRVLWDLFDEYDLFLTPTLPSEAFGAKGPPPSEIDGKPIPLLWAVAFTYPFNLSGHPAASVRAGLSDSGMPVGLQIVGPRQRDDLVLQAARAFEKARPWNDTWPKVG